MLEFILLAIGLAGLGAAGYYDLRYTEFNDWIAYGTIISALFVKAVFSLVTGDITIITDSLLVGMLFLGLGSLFYFSRQWGDGDAWLLGALGFLFPTKINFPHIGQISSLVPFQAIILFNLFLVAFVYLVVYCLVLGFRMPKVRRLFARRLEKDFNYLLVSISGIVCIFLALIIYSSTMAWGANYLAMLVLLPAFLIFVAFFMEYANVIETRLFRKKIRASQLKVGDVLAGGKWRGITEKQLAGLKRKGGFVWIKEGVRFSPVFVITLIITVLFGGLIWV